MLQKGKESEWGNTWTKLIIASKIDPLIKRASFVFGKFHNASRWERMPNANGDICVFIILVISPRKRKEERERKENIE